jgi:chitodextrinase
VPYPDVRVGEYSGLDTTHPLDASVGASGLGSAMDSGTLTTTAADLVVGANYMQGGTLAAGSGFVQEILTNPDADILEDMLTSVVGGYDATASQTTAGWWVMQAVAFRPVNTSGDTSAPTTPSGLSATAVTSAHVNLSWSAASDNVAVTGYRIERCQGSGCTSFSEIGTSNGTSFSDLTVSASTTYGYRVRATDAAGNLSSYSSTATATTPADLYVQGAYATPQTPTSTVTVIYPSAQIAGDLNVVLVGWVDATSNVQSVTDTSGNTYTRAVGPTVSAGNAQQSIYYAKNITAASAGTNTVTVIFDASATYPDIRIAEYGGIDTTSPLDGSSGAAGSGMSMSSGSVTTTGSDLIVGGDVVAHATSDTPEGFTERIYTDPNADILEDRLAPVAGSYDTSATQNLWDWWVMDVAAFKLASGSSSGDTQAPTTPTGLTATAASSTQINLSWSASTDNVGVTGYRIERCSGASCSTFAQIATSASASYSDTGLTAATAYTYRIRATDAANNVSSYSSTASATTSAPADTTAPSAPTGLSATASSSTQINLSWAASSDDVGVTGYLVERCQGSGCSTFVQVTSVTGTTYSDSGLSAGTSYSYRIRATDAASNLSSYSSTATATTQTSSDTTPPSTPGSLTGSAASGNGVTLSWSASTDDVGVTGYLIEQCQGSGCTSFVQVANASSAAYSIAGLTPLTTYVFRIRATDAAGNLSSYSNSVTLTTGASGAICD